MDTRLLALAGAAALLLSTAAPAASWSGAPAAPAAALVAACPDGTEWIAVTGAAPVDGSLATLALDAAMPELADGCEVLFLAPLPGGAVIPDPGVLVGTQDAAVWSRGSAPVVRASDTP